MSRTMKAIWLMFLFGVMLNQGKVCKHKGFGPQVEHKSSDHKNDVVSQNQKLNTRYPSEMEDTIYVWDEQILDWIVAHDKKAYMEDIKELPLLNQPADQPIVLNWEMLQDIRYELQYFREVDMKMFAPVFKKSFKALHGREVIIEGFVIPFEEEHERLALSANPYSSCFFCGKAGPASVISMYLKKAIRCKPDDYKKFKGTLYLNRSDPENYYYILRNAVQI